MKQLLEQIVKGIVNVPDAVQIEERESVDFPGLTILEISVDGGDKGILIGRRGRTINAIRDIMTISAIRNSTRIKVLVKDDRAPSQGENNGEKSHGYNRNHNDSMAQRKEETVVEEEVSHNRVDETVLSQEESDSMLSDDVL